MNKLKSCPFCGSLADLYDTIEDGFYISCGNCYCDVGYYRDDDGYDCGYFKSEEEAIDVWNRRNKI